MENEIKTAILTDDEGVEYELEVIKEFDYKDKHYAVLFEGIDECECGDDCECEGDCDCKDENESNEECDCNEECTEECTCECHDDEETDEEDRIYILEVVQDENGKDVYTEVTEDLMQELIPVVEKELYPTEE